MSTVNDASAEPSGVKFIFRALKYRNYRLYFAGQGISLVGTWMQQIAMSWLVYRMTNSAFLLGMVGFLGNLPVLFFAPLAGVLADRWNRLRMIVWVQVAAMLQATILAVLVLTKTIQVWELIVLSIILGIVASFDIPIRQSFIRDLVERPDELSNAIALNSSMVNGSRLIGPTIAGILIATTGEGVCFLINAISFVAVIAALLAMKMPPSAGTAQHRSIIREMKDGVKYAYDFVPIRYVLLLLSLISLVGMPYTVLMPIFAKNILGGGAHTLGFLMSATGVGALCGAAFLASRKKVNALITVIAVSASIFGLGLILFSFSRVLWLSLAMMLITGFGMMVHMASCNTMLQTISEQDKRGRIMSFFTMAFRGVIPFGSLAAGSMAASIGAPYTLMIGGMACALGALLYARKLPTIRKESDLAIERNHRPVVVESNVAK
jgi:MFS family permease